MGIEHLFINFNDIAWRKAQIHYRTKLGCKKFACQYPGAKSMVLEFDYIDITILRTKKLGCSNSDAHFAQVKIIKGGGALERLYARGA